MRADFPPLATLTGHNLPAERDAFVGRREPLGDLARRLDAGARLVSVLGLGGTGKTRLVTRFGWDALGNFPGGVWFCDLSEARSLDGIVYAVAQGLDVPLGKDDPVIQLGHAIAGRGKCLVILDNFEQVARHAEETLGRWLNRAGDARFLVTTREVLGLPGEEIIALPPLAPSDAADLFHAQGRGGEAGIPAEREDQAAIAPLVKLLEACRWRSSLRRRECGAASADAAPADERAVQAAVVDRRPAGPAGDAAGGVRLVVGPAVVPEKAALAQLSVFEGGFTLESVEAFLISPRTRARHGPSICCNRWCTSRLSDR